MKHIASITSVALLSAGLFTGCGSNSSSAVKLLPSIRGGSKPGTPGSEKVLPIFRSQDQLNILFAEMNRTERLLRNIVRAPTESANSCTKYKSTPTKRGVFLVMTYDKCGYTQELSDNRGKYVFRVDGPEIYERKSSRIEVAARLSLMVGPFGSRTATMRPKASYELEAEGDDGAGKIKTVQYASVYGSEKSAAEDYWLTSVDDGVWIQTGQDDFLKMGKGTSFKLVYRSGAGAKKVSAEGISLSATDDVTFAEKCPWPVSGTFEFKAGSEKPAIVTVSPTGFTFGDLKTEIKWPTDHCLGVKQN